MASERITHGIRNARTSLAYYFIILVVNLVSRKIFLEYLGDTVSGLTTTMTYTVGLLNLADIGIVTAITFALFKPISEDNKTEINRIISLFCFLFRWVGLSIIAIGVVLIFFIPSFVGNQVPIIMGVASFCTFLFTTSLSYFVNYKQHLLTASQKGYVIVRIFNLTTIAKIGAQMAALVWLGMGYYSFLALEVIFAILYSIILERKVKRAYPWLKPTYALGRKIRKEYKQIFKSLKQIISHKFANVVLTQTDSIVIAQFISLSAVTLYYNYAMIISKLTTLITSLFSGSWAGVGNLITEGNKKKTYLVYRQYTAVTLFLAGVLCGAVWFLADPFITVWLGGRYVLDSNIFLMMIASLYVALLRQPINVFLNGYALYRDVWSAWLEAALNIVISIIGSIYWGLVGVVAGTAISTALIVLGWKPYFLFKYGLEERVRHFYLTLLKYGTVLVLVEYVIKVGVDMVGYSCSNLFNFFIYAAIITGAISAFYGLIIYSISPSMRSVVRIFINRRTKK